MKITKLIPLSLVVILNACNASPSIKSEFLYCFDTKVDISIKDASDEDYSALKKILNKYDAVSDNFRQRSVFNVFSWSQTEEEVYFGEEEGKAPIELFNLVKASHRAKADGADYFDPRLGSLINKWKEAEAKGEILEQSVIDEEIETRNNSYYTIHTDDDPNQHYIVQHGVRSFDYGATAKGCALDACKEYLDEKEELTDYIINAGSSSILLGTNSRKKAGEVDYLIKIKELNGKAFYAHDCFVSTSGTLKQGITIDGKRYSHIVHSKTGLALTNWDEVIVLSNNGTYGDAFSTSMMFNTIEEITSLEEKLNLKTIIIKDKKIVYYHNGIKFK